MWSKQKELDLKLFLIGASVAMFYGLLIRAGGALFPRSDVFAEMSIGFVLLLPFAMGFITIFWIERRQPQSTVVWAFMPWIPVLGGTLATMLMLWEGAICAVMFLPISATLATIGGLAGGFAASRKHSTTGGNLTLGCVLVLPLLITPWEARVFSKNEHRDVDTAILIHASPETVWRNIERVREIQPTELRSSWTQRIGFPAPLEATLSAEGVGGVRHATFTGGVLFIENVDEWVPNERLGFSIHAQTNQIPKWTLDDHVRVGGEFFDVLRGQYVIEALPGGVVRLRLSSTHRLTTDFNWYAHLWSDGVMRDIQNSILDVIRNRCEAESLNATLPTR